MIYVKNFQLEMSRIEKSQIERTFDRTDNVSYSFYL
jgi:hypothetical protein